MQGSICDNYFSNQYWDDFQQIWTNVFLCLSQVRCGGFYIFIQALWYCLYYICLHFSFGLSNVYINNFGLDQGVIKTCSAYQESGITHFNIVNSLVECFQKFILTFSSLHGCIKGDPGPLFWRFYNLKNPL